MLPIGVTTPVPLAMPVDLSGKYGGTLLVRSVRRSRAQ